jgi:hypothetical protein
MSTKTNFKRIALVAVAALGLGVLSSVPAQAAVSGFTVTVADGTAGLAGVKTDSTNAATITLTGVIGTADSITVSLVEQSKPASTTPVISIMNLDSLTPTLQNTMTIDSQTTVTAAAGTTGAAIAVLDTARSGTVRLSQTSGDKYFSHKLGVQLDSATSTRLAGTYTYQVIVKTYEVGQTLQPTTTQTKTLNIVIAAAADVSNTAVAANGFAFLSPTTTTLGSGTATMTDSSISALATVGTTRGYLYVGVRNAANGAGTADESLTATVTGVGLVCLADGTSCGKSLGPISTTAGDYEFQLRGDGAGGTSSIKVTGSVTGASYTKTVSYYTAAAKTITATVAHPALRVGANSGPVRVTAVDAAGANWTGTFYIVASAAADALVGGSATAPVQCGAYSATLGYAACDITTLTTGTAKFKVIDAATVAAATATSNEVTVTVTNDLPASVKLSFDKATYAPNERARIYVTPLNSAGKEFQLSTTTDLFAAGGITLVGSVSYAGSTTTADSLTATQITTSASTSSTSGAKAGSMVYTVYMPAAGGTVTLSATGGNGLPIAGRVAVTATATVTDSGAAALAAVNALATTVASLRTLITTLTNLVLKIQKKVRA